MDTRRDDPNIIRRYLSNFSNSFIGMMGEASELKKLGDSLGAVFYHRTKWIMANNYRSLFKFVYPFS